MRHFKFSTFSILILIVAVIIFTVTYFKYIKSSAPVVQDYNDRANNTSTTTGSGSLANLNQQPASTTPTTVTTKPAPTVANLAIPFTSQAPTANWDLEHNEDCEEASGAMANAYLSGNTAITLPAAQVESEMTTLNNWEDAHLGYHLDTTAEETAKMITGVYGLQTKIITNYSLQDIKDQINLHHVVILPVNGQIIGNPNYTQPGPIYHMLVVRGYTSTGLITNDSGTRKGQNYPYAFNTLYNAGADWDHTTNTIDQNKKVMIVVSN